MKYSGGLGFCVKITQVCVEFTQIVLKLFSDSSIYWSFKDFFKLASRVLTFHLSEENPFMKTVIVMMFGLLTIAMNLEAQTKVSPTAIPAAGTFYLMSAGAQSPPFPFDPYPGLGAYAVGDNIFLIDDRQVAAAKAALGQRQLVTMDDEGPPVPPGSSTNGGGGSVFPAFSFDTNQLWIEVTGMDTDDDTISFLLHNTTNALVYQLWSKTNLTDDNWTWGPYQQGFGGVNFTTFNSISMDNSNRFFRAVGANDLVSIDTSTLQGSAIKPCSAEDSGTAVPLVVVRSPSTVSNLTVQWTLGGSAVYGQDYILTNLDGGGLVSNTVTVLAGSTLADIEVVPLYDTNLTFDVAVTLSLVLTNGYLINADQPAITVPILSCPSNDYFTVVTNLDSPVGIDYDPVLTNVVVSLEGGFYDGIQYDNFVRLGVNGLGALTLTNWSKITGLTDEVKLHFAKSTVNGFTNGQMFFSSDVNVGKLSTDGTISNLSWCVLTNATYTNAVGLRGGLYIDRSDSFNNDLIVVTGGSNPLADGDIMGIWRIHADTSGISHPVLLANINTLHLEGVITLTNDIAKWGPWAGKIITGDEDEDILYAIATNGIVTSYNTAAMTPGGIGSEDFDLISTNQDLYCVDESNNTIEKISRTYFNDYVGDLLITQSGDSIQGATPELFIVYWDPTNSVFNVRSISGPGEFEHVTFAPINLPSQPLQ